MVLYRHSFALIQGGVIHDTRVFGNAEGGVGTCARSGLDHQITAAHHLYPPAHIGNTDVGTVLRNGGGIKTDAVIQNHHLIESRSFLGYDPYGTRSVPTAANAMADGDVKVTMDYKQPVIAEDAVQTVNDTEWLNSTKDLDVTVLHLEEDNKGKVTDVVDMTAEDTNGDGLASMFDGEAVALEQYVEEVGQCECYSAVCHGHDIVQIGDLILTYSH